MEKRQGAGAISWVSWIKKGILIEGGLLLLTAGLLAGRQREAVESRTVTNAILEIENNYIKWVDFTVSYEALCSAYEWDVKTHGAEQEIDWVELLAYTAARTGGSFDKKALKTMEKAAQALAGGEKTMEELTEGLKYYTYYKEAYGAAIGGLVGEYQTQTGKDCAETYETVYGLKGYFPLARGFDYTHYDDFGVSRSYGYKRQHLGHDMMGLVGTPT